MLSKSLSPFSIVTSYVIVLPTQLTYLAFLKVALSPSPNLIFKFGAFEAITFDNLSFEYTSSSKVTSIFILVPAG